MIRVKLHYEKKIGDIVNVVERYSKQTSIKAVKSVSEQFIKKWKENTKSLERTRGVYNAAMRSVKFDDGDRKGFRIWLDMSNPLVKGIEQGMSPFDMKPGLLAKGAELSKGKHYKKKDGSISVYRPPGKYKPIAFIHKAAKGYKSKYEMVRDVYDIVRSEDFSGRLSQEDIPSFVKITKRETIFDKNTGAFAADEFIHGTNVNFPKQKPMSKYAGMIKKEHPTRKGSQYLTFRSVSTNSDPNSWIHSGIQARNLLQKTANEFNVQL